MIPAHKGVPGFSQVSEFNFPRTLPMPHFGMHTLEGFSAQTDGSAAVAEATQHWSETPEMLFVFCSSKQDADAVAKALAERYPGVPMAGCSTSGEHLSGAHKRDSLVLAGLCETGVDWVVDAFDGLQELDDAAGETFAAALIEKHGADAETLEPDDFVALLFVDGLKGAEERISAALASGLQGIPLAGGSAGDDLAFQRTTVICNGSATDDRATVVLARSRGTKFKVLKHQHFTTEPQLLAVTRADTAQRIIYELDGYPAAEAYARALGIEVDALGGSESFTHPFTFSCDGELYVRSFLSADEDGSMKFYCAIEEGMVLQIGAHQDMKATLDEDLEQLRGDGGQVDFMINFNCVLRALEATEGEKWGELGESVCSVAKSSIGFDTYGEQLNGLHINQTLVAVAFSANQEEARVSA